MPIDRNDPEVQALIDEITSPLIAKRDELLKEVKTFKHKARGADIDPEEFSRIQSERDELESKYKTTETKLKLETEKFTKLVGEKDAALSSHLIDAEMANAIAKSGIANHYGNAVKAMFKNQAQVVQKDGQYVVMAGEKSLAETISAWAAGDEGKHFVSATMNTGGGAAGNKSALGNAGLKRSDMTPTQMREYIAEHGQAAYLKLPK